MKKTLNTLIGLRRTFASASAAVLLAACNTLPAYQAPAAEVPPQWSQAQGQQAGDGIWKPARPADEQARGEWWRIFQDPQLDTLQSMAAAANQDLKAGVARLAQARSRIDAALSAGRPQASVGFGPTRQRPSPAAAGLPADADTQPRTVWRAQADLAWEVDLFGRIGQAADAASATAQQSAALLNALQLAVQADVANAWFTLRELDALLALYRRTVELREDGLRLVQRRFDEGDISELDLARSRTELASARAEAIDIARRRLEVEHALAVLVGQAPSAFNLQPQPLTRLALDIPAGLPSDILQRRADIAAAERAVAAAHAQLGVAHAAWFPSLRLNGTAGFEAADLGDLGKWASRSFLLGPLVGTVLSTPLFDGGARDAEQRRAAAMLDERVANYRQTVLHAFREVEDGLAQVRLNGEQTQAQDEAVAASRRAASLSQLQYREGSVSHLVVIDADRSVLQQQRVSVQLEAERIRSAIRLIRALGGGWQTG